MVSKYKEYYVMKRSPNRSPKISIKRSPNRSPKRSPKRSIKRSPNLSPKRLVNYSINQPKLLSPKFSTKKSKVGENIELNFKEHER